MNLGYYATDEDVHPADRSKESEAMREGYDCSYNRQCVGSEV